MKHPPQWKSRQEGGVLWLEAPESAPAFSIASFWISSETHFSLSDALNPQQFFDRTRRIESTGSLRSPYESLGFAGEAYFPSENSWWKRLWKSDGWRKWTMWGVRHRMVYLVATILHPGTDSPPGDELWKSVLETLEFAEQPAAPPDIFLLKVLKLAERKFPLLKVAPAQEFHLRLGESTINLFNFYRSYIEAPERFEEIVLPALTTVVQLQELGPDQLQPPLEQVRDRVMPMLYPESIWRTRFPQFVAVPWIAELVIVFVVDESNAYWFISDELRQQWDLSEEELHELAIENLQQYFQQHATEFAYSGDEHPRVIMPIEPDAYHSTRLLSDAFREKLRELLGTQFIVGIPNRDFFVAISLDSAEAVSEVRRRVADDFQKRDHPLCGQLLLVSADGISEYTDETWKADE